MTTRKLTQLPILTVVSEAGASADAEVQGWNIAKNEKDEGDFEYLDIRIEIVATDVETLDTCSFLSMTKEQALLFASDIIKEVTDA